MGAFLARFFFWKRLEAGENGEVETDSVTSDESISSTNSLITRTQVSPLTGRGGSRELKDVPIEILPVDLLLR